MATANKAQRAREGYASPVLRKFGSIAALTQSGTGAQVEASNPNGMCVSGPNRAMC